MQNYQQLAVWKRAHGLVLRVYTISKDLPPTENFGLVLNLRRIAVTIPRAIAEGCGRGSDAEFAMDLKRARAAGYELDYIFLLCRDLGFFGGPLYQELNTDLGEIRKMISGLMNRLTMP